MPNLGAPEIILILLVIVLLFGAKKLPETARGLGRSLRIFKAETKGLSTDDEGQSTPPEQPRQITAQADDVTPPPATPTRPAETEPTDR